MHYIPHSTFQIPHYLQSPLARESHVTPGPMIRFGTDGWRALVAEEFTFANVRAVAQAIADYLRAHPPKGRSLRVIVGHDTRPLGDRFAAAVAEVLAGNGMTVLFPPRFAPTPAVSFAIKHYRLAGGVVVTASHNPFSYNGLKFKPWYAGPAEPAMTAWIERRLFQRPVRRIPFGEGVKRNAIRAVEILPDYLKFLRRYVEWPVLAKAGFRVAVDAMRGAGEGLVEAALRGSRIQVVPLVFDPLDHLSEHRPEPIGEHLQALEKLVRRERCDVGLATDGDADRAGIVGPDGRFVSSQETMALLVWHLLEDRRWRGTVVKTVAGTNLLSRIAAAYGVPLKETPVGFKHIAHFMLRGTVLFGGEESGGFGFTRCVPERDGILAGLLVLELMAMRRQGLPAILAALRRRFGAWRYRRIDVTLSHPLSPTFVGVLCRRLPQRIAGLAVRRMSTLDGLKVTLADESWLLWRASGTEPLLRIYAEASTDAQVDALLTAGQRLVRRCLAPC